MTTDALAIDATRQAVVFAKDGEVFTNSLDVAASFDKRHTEVLRAIHNLIQQEPELGQRNFASFKTNDLTGESTSHYDMDRDGFTLLAMGFTGAKALKWKLRYIEAFNAMEAELRRLGGVNVPGAQIDLLALLSVGREAAALPVYRSSMSRVSPSMPAKPGDAAAG